jgi:hypothetical protein
MIFLRKNIELLYLFFIAIQVVLISQYCINSLPIALPHYFYFESVAIVFNDHKRVELLSYMFGVIVLGLFFMGIVIGESKLNLKARRYALSTLLALIDWKNKKLLLIALFLCIILPTLVFKSNGSFDGKLIIQTIGLGATLVFPFWNYFLRYKAEEIECIKKMGIKLQNYSNIILKKNYFYIMILVIAFLQLGYLFYDPIVNQPKIINEYLTIPEQTIMKNGQKVENNDYLKVISSNGHDNKEIVTDPFSAQKLHNSQTDEWLESNQFEIRWQVLSRFMIHHNSFMFIPISDFMLDKNIHTINAQYGLGGTWFFTKLFSLIGDVSFDNWLKVSYAFYYFYFGLFVAIVFAITRSLAWTTAIFLISLTLINNRGYDFLLLPPGESPWRHFFDISIIYFLYLYGEKKKTIYYLFALGLGILSVALSPQVGLMICVATIVSGIFYTYYEKRPLTLVLIASFLALIITMGSFFFLSSANDLAQYYLDGVIGFPISSLQLFKIFVFFSVGYILFLKILRDRLLPNYGYLLFLIIYTQELILYIIWHYDSNGFKSRAFIYVLTVALLLFPFRKLLTLSRWKHYIILALSLVIATVYIRSIVHVHKSKHDYEKIFDHHVTYQWTMDRAHILSTMNPVYFQNGVDLIQKYTQGDNGIYIVSEYDNFLPFLAHKYSLMPFFDLKWYLLTPKELHKSITILQTKKPKYLFVDTGIDRDLTPEIIDSDLPEIGYLHQESIWRAQRLRLLNDVFQGVANDYTLVEKGYLISVYQRKDLQ